MSKNANFHSAKRNKNNEFYTRYEDIDKELLRYKDQFTGKTVYCNCDNPEVSQFFKYFFLNFKLFALKKLIATGYNPQDRNLFSDNPIKKGLYVEYERKNNDSPMPDLKHLKIKELKGDGDFRSSECKEFLKSADIIVTNPPFSLFNDFIELMMEFNKKFIILGNKNAVRNKKIFPLVIEKKVWFGYTIPRIFELPDNSTIDNLSGLCRWFTNLECYKTIKPIYLSKKYNKDEYPTYDTFNAINVDKVKNIPIDYNGYIGVPVTFVDKWDPDVDSENSIASTNDYDIIGILSHGIDSKYDFAEPIIKGKKLYSRLIIKKKEVLK